jgi:hypothetical protein
VFLRVSAAFFPAAEVFSSMEDHARKTEARAQLLCKSAAERLGAAEKQIEIAERLRRELITETACKLQDASRATLDEYFAL